VDLVRRRAGSVLGLGLISMLGWSLAVSASMPSWFDPDRDCARLFYQQDSHGLRITTQWLPPRATCEFAGGEVRDYISPTRSNVLMIIFAVTALVTAFGLYFVVRRLFEPAGIVRSAEAVDLRARQIRHLTTGGVLNLLVAGAYSLFNAAALFLAGPPGGLVLAVVVAVGLAALAAALDRATGPLPSTALDSRKRGTAVGLGAFAAIFAAAAVTGELPFFRLWVAPVGAIAFVLLACIQWSRSDGGAGDGDAVEQDLLGDPRP
jgi:hypothetical protein